MDFKPKKARVEVDGRLSERYHFPLQMYLEAPQVLITLNEFEELAVERLKGKALRDQLAFAPTYMRH